MEKQIKLTGEEWEYVQKCLDEGIAFSEAIDGIFPELWQENWTNKGDIITIHDCPDHLLDIDN